jgi:hypothetical protein
MVRHLDAETEIEKLSYTNTDHGDSLEKAEREGLLMYKDLERKGASDNAAENDDEKRRDDPA